MTTKVLVGILHSNENEFQECLASLARQTFVNHELHVIENLPNKQAHDALYYFFMNNSNSFDLFLKLDADMTFAEKNSLEKMEVEFTSEISHLFAYVLDHPSSIKIPGIQMFRSGTRWNFTAEPLNVDYPPVISGKTKMIVDANFINHMIRPNDYQLFRYGIHKALKSVQPDRKQKSPQKALLHIAILNGIARNYFNGKAELLWSMIGATIVYSGTYQSIEYNSNDTRDLFERLKSDQELFDESKVRSELMWKNEIQSMFRWWETFNTVLWA